MIGRWIAGAGLSGLAHMGAAAAILWTVAPQSVRDQAVPETQMQLDAWAVERSQAAETTPDSAKAEAGDASGANLSQGAIPQTRAAAATVSAAKVAAISALGARASVVENAAEAATALATPTETIATVTTPPAEAAAVQVAALSVAPASAALPVETAPTSSPEPEQVAQREAPSQPLSQSQPMSESVAEATDQARPALAAEPEVTRSKAALAFATAGDGPVDPVSLAAFQSFMQPGDLGGAAADVRDGIAGLLSQVPCSRMQVQFQPETNTLQLTGHVPEDGLRAPVLAALQGQMGANITVADNLLILPRPQCGALAGISAVGLAQSTDQITNPLLVGEDTHARAFSYAEGEALVLDLAGADYDSYVYVDFFDAAGNVIHLSPNEFTPLELVPAEAPLKIGADAPLEAGVPGLYIEIGPPFGQEIAVAFASSAPLYEGTRPLVEPAAAYLEWLTERVSAAREANPDFKGEWVYFFVTTGPK